MSADQTPARDRCAYCGVRIECWPRGNWIASRDDTRQCVGKPIGVLHAPRALR
jgi:hypothetical protein